MKGLFGSLFDFNGDGNLDPMEAAMETMFFMDLMDEDDKKDEDEEDDLF